ncbi:Band 7 domain [Sesbania bispinosa]|nr:Band 7 domain [Sesbania bispinosa]
MYRVANASEYLVITGVGIKDIKLAKKAWVLPGQSYTVFDVSPVNYTFEVQAMSAEKLPFVLPAVFTIGPRVDDEESLLKYARLISPHDKLSNHVKDLVQGIIEGETRVLAASMTMEEIFKGTKDFKQEVFEKVQLELNQFGLLIYNANVKQLVDVPGHEYFSYLGQKTQMEAANQAKVDVAEAKMKGEIGAKLREGQTLQNAAKIDAETKIISTQRQGEGKKGGNQEKSFMGKAAQVAEVEAAKAVALREAELQREVERMNALTTTEKLRAEFLSKASVEYETKIAKINAEAIRGLEPKISIWTNGGEITDGSGAIGMKEVAGVYKMLPPLFKTVHEQTGMLPPAWMGTLPDKSP